MAHDGKELTPDRFRKLLEDDGFQVLGAADAGDPTGRAWTEFGNLDSTGHDEGIGLARRIPELIANLVQRIESLLAAGWKEVRVVTDHGWLLLPKGLPKSELPKYLTATRWRRCAVVKPNATVELALLLVVLVRGRADRVPAGDRLLHGGGGIQPRRLELAGVRRPAILHPSWNDGRSVSAKIENVKWARLRCRVKVTGEFDGCTVDLRDKAADPTTSLAGATARRARTARSALVVEDDTREGTATTLVLLDAAGTVIDKTPVTVGG